MTEKDQYVYNKEGFLEAVMFVFVQGNKLLIEHRMDKVPPEPFIPNGKIETKDQRENNDYKQAAVKREISEEFGTDVVPTQMEQIGEFSVPQIKAVFYIYLIKEWTGEITSESYEEGKVSASLEWVTAEAARQIFSYPVLNYALDLLEQKDL